MEYCFFYWALLQETPMILRGLLIEATLIDTRCWCMIHVTKWLQDAFIEYRLFYRALLQETPMILRGPLIEATLIDTRCWCMIHVTKWLQDAFAAACNTAVKTECVVCMVKEPVMAVMPCGHLCLCEDCDSTVTICPVCRRCVESLSRIYVWIYHPDI